MLLIRCPYCDMDRPEIEFSHGGEAHRVRAVDPSSASDAEWGAFLYLRDNKRGLLAERWRHNAGCGRYFTAVRHTVSDHILITYKTGEPRPDPETLAREPTP